jgi:hypothetical protein
MASFKAPKWRNGRRSGLKSRLPPVTKTASKASSPRLFAVP